MIKIDQDCFFFFSLFLSCFTNLFKCGYTVIRPHGRFDRISSHFFKRSDRRHDVPSSGINNKLNSLLFFKRTILIRGFFFLNVFISIVTSILLVIYIYWFKIERIDIVSIIQGIQWCRNFFDTEGFPSLEHFFLDLSQFFWFFSSTFRFNLAIEIRLYKIVFDYLILISIYIPSNKYKISVKEFSNCRKIYFNSKFKKLKIYDIENLGY